MTVLRTIRAAGAIGAILAFLMASVSPELAVAAQKHKISASKSKSGASKGKASASKKKSTASRKASSKSRRSSKSSKSSSRSRGSHSAASRAETRTVAEEHVSGSALGKVIEADGPARTVAVKKGQGLDAVARESGVDKKQIIDLNKLKSPYPLRAGQKLKLPSEKGKAYVTEAGDTLTAIGKRFGLSAKEIAGYNDLRANATLRPGRKLQLPAGFKDSGPLHAPKPEVLAQRSPAREYARPLDSAPPAGGYNRAPPTLAPIQPRVDTPPPPVDAGQVASLGSGRFSWPLQGRIVQPFGTRAGQADDGITIAAPVGTPVHAAAAGTVIYSGRQIAEFGNYVLIQHEGGFLTAYGNMDRVNVRMNQKVAQGEQIGQSGQTGTASQPQLHFEILFSARREDKSTPVDPASLLPKL